MQNSTGVIQKKRSEKEIKKDTSSLELAYSVAPKWKEKKRWKKYTVRNQKGTYTCMAQTGAKIVEVTYPDKVFSASPIYAERANSGAGMWLGDLFEILTKKEKITLESRIKSQMLKSDAEIEKEAKKWNEEDTKISEMFSPEKYAYCSNDIDEIAGHLEAGVGLALVTFGTVAEWSKEKPQIIKEGLQYEDKEAVVKHGIAIVDYGLIGGVKHLKIEDSAHFGGISERWIDQKWLNKRCMGVGFVIELGEMVEPTKPHYVFNNDLDYGMLKNKDVVALQDALKWLQLFDPRIESTGNFLGETFRAVIRFQEKYRTEILSSIGLREATGRFHKSSRKKMNELLK